ncbi:MAG: TetR/AcrR family transcriptional regulator [Thermoleophilia bacterium]|nr:TetR/AcrR family transcriptional regulator [Thermoleophilia bacterium]
MKSRTRPYHHGDLRATLMATAMRMIEEQPVERLSLRALSRAAGVSHAAPYHYFPDRAALLKAVGDEAMREFAEALEDGAASDRDARGSLYAMGRAYVRFATQRPRAFGLIFDPDLCPPGDPGPDRGPLIARAEAALEGCVERLRRTGWRPRQSTAVVALALWAGVHGLARLVADGYAPADGVDAALEALVADA